MIKRLLHSMQLGGNNIIMSNGNVLYIGTKQDWEVALRNFKGLFKEEGNYKTQRQINKASKLKEHSYHLIVNSNGDVLSVTKQSSVKDGYASVGPAILSTVINLNPNQLSIFSKKQKVQVEEIEAVKIKKRYTKEEEEKIIDGKLRVFETDKEIKSFKNKTRFLFFENDTQKSNNLLDIEDSEIITKEALDTGVSFIVTDASCQPFMLNTSGAGLIITKDYFREIRYSKFGVKEDSTTAELRTIVEAIVSFTSFVETNLIEKPTKVICFVDNTAAIRFLDTPYTKVDDTEIRKLVRVGRTYLNKLNKIAKNGVEIFEIHPKLSYNSKVETLMHNSCDSECKNTRIKEGIIREVIECHSK